MTTEREKLSLSTSLLLPPYPFYSNSAQSIKSEQVARKIRKKERKAHKI